jgi:predicted transcriptional regulator
MRGPTKTFTKFAPRNKFDNRGWCRVQTLRGRKFLKSPVNLPSGTILTIKEGTDFQKAKLPKIFKISREFSSRDKSDNRCRLLGGEAPENF